VNEKPLSLDMSFGEALARLAKVPKTALPEVKPAKKKAGQPKASPAKVVHKIGR
jgi:hypothetical protein